MWRKREQGTKQRDRDFIYTDFRFYSFANWDCGCAVVQLKLSGQFW